MPIEPPIAGRYIVDITRPLSEAGGGLPAFACQGTRPGGPAVMAVRVQPDRPPRADALEALIGHIVPGVLLPLAHGAYGDAYYIVCAAPHGASLAAGLAASAHAPRQPWAEQDVLDNFLRPAAQALAGIAARGVTHRAINLGNVFRPGPGTPVQLGTAWAAPPASLQPPIYEPPYVGACIPTGRGNGAIADDVYALGVMLIALATGRLPLAEMDDTAMLRHKLDVGSFQALAGNDRLPNAIADLARGMLAEDPTHRPLPEMLVDPAAARSRRVAARPPRRAARPLDIGKVSVANARGLAAMLGRDNKAGVAALRGGQVEHWLRRGLGDATLAAQIEDVTRLRATQEHTDPRADAVMLARTVAMLDPLAPICWPGLVLWPDGIGTALAGARGDPVLSGQLADLIDAEFVGPWAAIRARHAESAEDSDEAYLRREARRMRTVLNGAGRRSRPEAAGDGLIRLRYLLNPLLPCASALLAGHWVANLKALLPTLEATAGHADHTRPVPYDPDIAAFVAARTTRRDERDATAHFPAGEPDTLARTPIWLYANLQTRLHPGVALPDLSRWLVAAAAPLVANWENRLQRQAIVELLAEQAPSGQLVALMAILEDPTTRDADKRGAAEATEAAARIDAALLALAEGGPARAELARRMGQELATGVGLAGMAGILTSLVLG